MDGWGGRGLGIDCKEVAKDRRDTWGSGTGLGIGQISLIIPEVHLEF